MIKLTAFILCLSSPLFAQDVIFKHKGEELNVKVLSVNENSISFSYPNETTVNTIGKPLVAKIKYESGRVETVSEIVTIDGEDGWQNVLITNNPNDIVGLKRLGEIKSKAGGYASMRTTKGSDKKATERIKREAAKLGGHIVFIQQHETSGGSYGKNPESFQSGVAYGY